MKLDIEKFHPCEDGKEWHSHQPSSIEAWYSCKRGDWMLWGAENLGVDEKKIILAAAKCANTVRHLMKDERSRNAVDTFIAYVEGRATLEELEKAKKEASKSFHAAYAAYYASAARAYSAAYEAASAASFAAFWAAGESQEAKKANQLQTANICREILTNDIIKIIEIIEKH